MGKKYLKGFSGFGFHEVDKNTEDEYSVKGDRVKIPSAKSCSPSDNRTDFKINADDGVWDSGSELTDVTNEVTFAEMDLDTLAKLTGATVNEDGSIDESSLDVAPELALTYRALRADGGYRLYKYYVAKVTKVTVNHTTKGENNDAQSYTVTFSCVPRKCDNKLRSTKDIDKDVSQEWLNTIDSVPAEATTANQEPTGDEGATE
ncbi:MAG: major tail protein [Acutalibacteraceae bacterium]|nr:major tail protein [Acutalibacteraceae bacterium]